MQSPVEARSHPEILKVLKVKGLVLCLNKVLCCVFLFANLALRCTEHNVYLLLTEELTNRKVLIGGEGAGHMVLRWCILDTVNNPP